MAEEILLYEASSKHEWRNEEEIEHWVFPVLLSRQAFRADVFLLKAHIADENALGWL